MKDLIGQAIWDYYHRNSPGNLQTETSISHLDDLPIPYLFREFYLMNPLEKKAMQLAKNPTGHIFALKNLGWSDKQEIDHTSGGEKIEPTKIVFGNGNKAE